MLKTLRLITALIALPAAFLVVPFSSEAQTLSEIAEQVEYHLFEAELYLEEGQILEAAATLAQVVALAPENVDARLLLARALTTGILSGMVTDVDGAAREALEHYQFVLDRQPDNPEAIRGRRLLASATEDGTEFLLTTEDARKAWRKGQDERRKQNWKRAAKHFRKVAELEPDVAVVHRAVGECLHRSGELSEAHTAFARALELDPQDFIAHTGSGVVLEGQNKNEEALTHFRRAFALEPRFPESAKGIVRILGDRDPQELETADKGLLGRALVVVDRYDRAVELLTEALEEDPTPALRKALGIAEFFRGNDAAALEALSEVHGVTPADPEVLYYLGALSLKAGRVDQAHNYLRSVLAVNPNNANALRLLGLSLADRPDSAGEAADLLVRAEEAGAIIDDLSCILGNLFMRVGRSFEAEAYFEECLGTRPDYAGGHLGLGVLADDHGRTRQAIDHFERYLELQEDPEVSAIFRLGVAYLRSGQDEKGFETLKRVVSLTGGDPDEVEEITEVQLLEMTSYFLASVRRFDDAIFIGEMLLTHDNDNPVYNNNLSMTYADADQNLGRAHTLALKANRLDPDNPGHIDTLGWALIRLNKLDEAEEVLLRAILLASGDGRMDLSEIYYHLGYLYRLQERHQEAEDYLVKALENPPTPFIRAEIERLLDTDDSEPR